MGRETTKEMRMNQSTVDSLGL